MFSFLHDLPSTFPPFLIHDVDKVNARRLVGNVDLQGFALALHLGHALAEGVEDLCGFQVFTCNGDMAACGIGINDGTYCGFVFPNARYVGLSPLQRKVWDCAETSLGKMEKGMIPTTPFLLTLDPAVIVMLAVSNS